YDPKFFAVSGPLTGLKRSLTEGGIRVPLIARWPGRIAAGRVSPHVGYFGDIMATFAELAGAKAPKGTGSLSFVPALLGRGDQPKHEFLYWEFYEGGVSQAVLLDSHWKGIREGNITAPVRLFDLQTDLAEQTNIADRNPEVVARIAGLMRT